MNRSESLSNEDVRALGIMAGGGVIGTGITYLVALVASKAFNKPNWRALATVQGPCAIGCGLGGLTGAWITARLAKNKQ